MNNPRNITEKRQEEIYPKVSPQTYLQENTKRRYKNCTDQPDNIHLNLLVIGVGGVSVLIMP